MRPTAIFSLTTCILLGAAAIGLLAWSPPAKAEARPAAPCPGPATAIGCPTPTPQTAFVTITAPSQAALPPDRHAFTVAGVARGLPAPQVTVRVRDWGHRIIDEQTATVEGPADGEGAWQTTLHPQHGLFYEDLALEAVAYDPITGAVVARTFASLNFYRGPLVEPAPDPARQRAEQSRRNREELALRCQVHVTWPAYTLAPGETLEAIAAAAGAPAAEVRRANCLTDAAAPAAGTLLHLPHLPGQAPASLLRFDAPLSNGVLTANAFFTVSGTLAGAAGDALYVRVLDAQGRTLAERAASLADAAAGAPQPWQTELVVPDLRSGTRALVYAYHLTADRRSVRAADAVPVIFGTNEPDGYLAIDAPLPYAEYPVGAPLMVRGRGKYADPLYATIVDSTAACPGADLDDFFTSTPPTAVDSASAPAPVTDDGVDAYGERRWHVVLQPNVAQRARVCVYDPSWYGGPSVEMAAVDVRFVDDAAATTVRVDYPLPETVYTNAEPMLTVHGHAPGAATLLLQNTGGQVLRMAPVAAGTSSYTTSLAPIEQERELILQLAGTPANADVAPLADRLRLRTAATDAMVTGVVSFTFMRALPETTVVRVFLDEIIPGAELSNRTMLGQQAIRLDWAHPAVPFAVRYDSRRVDPDADYAISARIENGSTVVLGYSTAPVPVITHDAPTREVVVVVTELLGRTGALATHPLPRQAGAGAALPQRP